MGAARAAAGGGARGAENITENLRFHPCRAGCCNLQPLYEPYCRSLTIAPPVARRARITHGRAFMQIIFHSMLRVSTLQSALLGRDGHVFPSSVHAFHSRVLFLHSQRAHPDGKAAAATGGAPLAADGGAPLVPLPLVRWRSVERRLARWFARSVGTQKASRRSLSTMCSDSGVCTSRTSTPRYLKLTRRRTRACRSQ